MKKLYRSQNKVVSGVLAGIAEYLKVDPVIVRIIFVVGVLASGVFPLVIAYIVAVFLTPLRKPTTHRVVDEQ